MPVALLLLASGCAAQAPAGSLATNPSKTAAANQTAAATAALDPLVRRACYDCHSNEGAAPWNAKLAFSYWFPSDALQSVNFSQWATYDAKRRGETRKAIADVVRSGDMPPIDYRVLHPSAKLTKDEAAAVVAWAESPGN
jgi:hypothetical protein